MAINHRQVTLTTTPSRLDLDVTGASIAFTPRGAIYLGSEAEFSVADATICRQVAANTPVGFSDLKDDGVEQIWAAAVSGTVVVDITDRGVNAN